MESRPRGMRRKAYHSMKMKRAVQLLFYKRHREPGVKGWELRKRLGNDYPKVLELIDDHLQKLGLTIKTVFKEESVPPENPSLDKLDKARFYVTLKGNLASKEPKLVGWRIDDIAGLAVSIGFILSKGGKASKTDLEDLLKVKLPGWRVDINLNRYFKSGYLIEDENAQTYLGWRTRAEIDTKKLIDLFLTEE